MFIYISIFIGILLVLLVCGYYFLPNSQLSLSFGKRNFIITVVILSVAFVYFLGFGIYTLNQPHEKIKIVNIDNQPHILDGVPGQIMFLEDKKIHADMPYNTVLFTWKPLGKQMPVSFTAKGTKGNDTLHLSETHDPLYNQLMLSVGAKYMYTTKLSFPQPARWEVTFGDKQAPIGKLTIDVYPNANVRKTSTSK